MNPAELGRQFLADLMRLPLLFKLFLLYAVGAAGWKWWKARRQAAVIVASTEWPAYKARVIWAQVSEWRHEGEDGPSYVEGLLTYSYTVPGHELEVGEYRKRFEDEDEANAWARALRDTFVDVRVNPADVTCSIWQETPILMPASPRMPELEASRLRDIDTWSTREVLAAFVFCVAAVGAFLAAWIQLSCMAGKPLLTAETNEGAFFGMHLGAFACGIAVSFIAHRGKWSKSNWRKSLKPGNKSAAMKILGAYTTVVFLYGWVRMAAKDGDSRYFGTLMFSAAWLMVYVAVAGRALQAMQHRGRDDS